MRSTTRTAIVAASALLTVACGSAAESPATEPAVTTTARAGTASLAVTTTVPDTTTTGPAAPLPRRPEISEATGVVIAVNGGLQGVDSFTLLLEDGSRLQFFPAPGLLFDGGPLSHLNEHMASGAPVHVVFVLDDYTGAAIAQEVGDD